MFYAHIKHRQLLAQYGFGGTFKWCYYASVKFARRLLYLHPEIAVITIEIEDYIIGVTRSGLMIDMPHYYYEVEKINPWRETEAYC